MCIRDSLQTFNGPDAANLRIHSINKDRVNVFVDEESSRDTETTHNPEVVGYVAITAGSIHAIRPDSIVTGTIQSFTPVENNLTKARSIQAPLRFSNEFAIDSAIETLDAGLEVVDVGEFELSVLTDSGTGDPDFGVLDITART